MELILWISQQTVQKTLQKHDIKRDEAKTELRWNTIKYSKTVVTSSTWAWISTAGVS